MDTSKLLAAAVAKMNLKQLQDFRDQLQAQLQIVESRISELSEEVSGDGD